MYKRLPPKPLGFMERTVVKSSKYKDVESKLDTGLTVDKVKFVTAQEYAKRRSEIFFRLSRRQLYDLYSEYEVIDHETINDVVDGHREGGLKIVTHDAEESQEQNTKPYLILDVREPAEYRSCHLLQARSLPYTMMRRDQTLPELYHFRNKPEMLIIIYCDDERISRDAAKLFVDRGTDNIFLLSGGLAEFAAEYPAFVEGNVPEGLLPKKRSSSSSSRTSELRAMGRGRRRSRWGGGRRPA